VSEPVISRVGEDRILVQMPGVENPAQLRDLLGSTAKMSFQMVARRSGTGVSLLEMRDGSGVIPVENRVALSGDRLDQAAMGFDPDTGRPMVTFAFDRQGAITFAEITAANIGQRFAVVLDGQVLTAPVIQSMIPGGQGQITGDFTSEEAQTLAVLLTSGALPASLEVIEERSVGAALGADSIRSGLITDFIEPWTQQVTECTNGEVQFEIFPAGTQMGNVARQQEQVMAGVVDIAHGLHGIPRGRFPATSLIDMPFLTDDAGAASYALWELFPEYLSDEYNGLKVLALHAHNGGVLHTNEKKVETIEDMKGLRIRTPSPAVSEMLSFLGADPQGLPPGEVYESLQRGVIDGTVFPWDPIKSFGLNEVLNYHLELGAYTVSFFFVMNERSYEGLSEEAQACVDKYSGGDLVAKFGDWWDMWDAPGRQDAIDAGHQITELSDEQRAQWEETLQPMMDAYLQSVKDAGVDNAEEIYLAMQDKIAEYEAAQQD
jgi:TRAP-type C4-dicarboxylate transport system substrate-binding protein